MEIIGKNELNKYGKDHASARKPIERWIELTESATWNNLSDVKATFAVVDYIPANHYCFDIGGNNYRLLTTISFTLGTVKVLEIMTHAKYNKRRLNTR